MIILQPFNGFSPGQLSEPPGTTGGGEESFLKKKVGA